MSDMPEIPNDLMKPQAAADLLGCDLSSIYRWVHHGRLRAWRLSGTQLRVSRADVLALLEPVAPVALPHIPKHLDPAESPGHKAACEKLRKAGYRF